ncbi:hypothetical protein GCM10008967_08650 [Bacillus carboniphilus]|uniref:Uncharacterized protein n=1 Tax=Bacillus carboniphilus TaxID=86663 RepID=A0ABP3FKY9_9BACI
MARIGLGIRNCLIGFREASTFIGAGFFVLCHVTPDPGAALKLDFSHSISPFRTQNQFSALTTRVSSQVKAITHPAPPNYQ